MTFLSKAVLFVLLLLGAGALGFFLHSDTVTAPTVTEETPSTEEEESADTPPVEDPVETPEPVVEEEVPSLITRNLSNQGIREVPRSEFERRTTEILDLSGNELVSLQAEIRQLSNLRVLDLSDNQMTNIPAEIGQLTKLVTLDLRGNRLTGLPYELGNLKNLKTLDLRGNPYSTQDLEIIKKGLTGTTILVD